DLPPTLTPGPGSDRPVAPEPHGFEFARSVIHESAAFPNPLEEAAELGPAPEDLVRQECRGVFRVRASDRVAPDSDLDLRPTRELHLQRPCRTRADRRQAKFRGPLLGEV